MITKAEAERQSNDVFRALLGCLTAPTLFPSAHARFLFVMPDTCTLFHTQSARSCAFGRSRSFFARWGKAALCLSAIFAGTSSAALAAPRPASQKKAALVAKTPSLPSASNIAQDGDYRLGPDDVLDVTVTNHPDLNSTLTVRPDGKISLPRAGDLTVTGKTTRQLAREIETRLARTLNNARVQIGVKQARPRQARIIGAVTTAGTYTIKPNTRVVDLVGMASGLSTKANRISGRVVRFGQVIPFDLAQAMKQPGSAANLPVRPDDLVQLDALNYARQITVMGQVAKPGPYDLEEELTVMALLAQAGGPLPDAALKKAHVLREGSPVISDLSAVSSGNIPANSSLSSFVFKAGDVLVVPENTARFGVLGQVSKPSYFSLSENAGDATVLKALSQAGGALPDGDLASATITRMTNGQTQTIAVDVSAMLSGKVPDNVTLQKDDLLIVPKRVERKASVIGQVARPGLFAIEENTTLLNLLAQAGNPGKGAGLSRAYVLRGGVQMPVNLRPAIIDQRVDGAIADFRVQADDTLVIPDVSDQIQVSGQVAKPGTYSLDDDLTLVSLIGKAGSTTDTAALSKAYVLRDGQRINFDLRGALAGNADAALQEFRFQPGDELVVPENPLRFAVMGQVAKPGGYSYPEDPKNATIINVLSGAGGPAANANLKGAGILRNVDGTPQVIPVNLADTLKTGAASNLQLLPGDVLYVPSKTAKTNILQTLAPLSLLFRFF